MNESLEAAVQEVTSSSVLSEAFAIDSVAQWQNDFWQALTKATPFAASVKPIGQLTPEKSFFIYQRAYFARLMEALGANHPATWWVLGDEKYLKLAREYVHEHPSENFDLGDFGSHFAEFLRVQKLHEEIPFVCDLALFEQKFLKAFHSRDVSADLLAPLSDRLAKIESDPEHTVGFHQSVQWLQSDFSVYEIWQCRDGCIDELSGVDWSKPAQYLLFKQDQRVHILPLEKWEYLVCRAIAHEKNIYRALDEVCSGDHRAYDSSVGGTPGDISPEQIQSLFIKIGPLLV